MKLTVRLLPFAMLLLGAVSASAQGIYYNIYLDGQYLGADDEGYPYDGVDCNTITVWNELSGIYLSGGAAYPNSVGLTNSVYAGNGGGFSWNIGFEAVVPDPLGGCSASSWSYSPPVNVVFTYTLSTNFFTDQNGYCPQAGNCSAGTTATCPISSIKDGSGPGQLCDAYHETMVAVLLGSCVFPAYSTSATGSGKCT